MSSLDSLSESESRTRILTVGSLVVLTLLLGVGIYFILNDSVLAGAATLTPVTASPANSVPSSIRS